MALRIERIDHVQIMVPRAVEEASKRFYAEVLGLEAIPKPPEAAKRGGAWYRLGSMQVHLSIEDIDAAANQASRRHVCYIVKDLSEAEKRLREAGVAILPDLNPEAGWLRFYVRDPGGNRIEIAQPLG